MAKKGKVSYKKEDDLFGFGGYSEYSKRYRSGFDYGMFDFDDYSSYSSRKSRASSSGHMDIVYPDMSSQTEDRLISEIEQLRQKKQLKLKSAMPEHAKLEDFMARDIFKQYYNKEVKYKMGKDNYWWKNLLGDMDNYMMKISTNNSYVNSTILTKHIVNALMNIAEKNPNWKKEMEDLNKQLREQAEENKEKQQGKGSGAGDGEGEPDEDDGQEGDKSGRGPGRGKGAPVKSAMDRMAGMQKAFEDAMEEAGKEISDTEKMLESFDGLDPHKSMEDFETMMMIKDVSGADGITIRAISRFVKKTIKGFKMALTGAVSTFEENLFEAEEVSDIVDMELMPFDMLLDDVNVKTNKSSIKFDIYIDASGSMSSSCDLGEGRAVSRMDLAKVLAYQMEKLGILNDVYTFTYAPKKIDKKKILSITDGGGTSIDNSIKNCVKTKVPSVILTDGDDTVNIYNENVYLLCVANGLVNLTQPMEKYCDKNKAVLFNRGKMMRGAYRAHMFAKDQSKRGYVSYTSEF